MVANRYRSNTELCGRKCTELIVCCKVYRKRASALLFEQNILHSPQNFEHSAESNLHFSIRPHPPAGQQQDPHDSPDAERRGPSRGESSDGVLDLRMHGTQRVRFFNLIQLDNAIKELLKSPEYLLSHPKHSQGTIIAP